MLKFQAFALTLWFAPAHAAKLESPDLRLPFHSVAPHVALTFDACSGRADNRILTALVEGHTKATVFVTNRWLKRNPEAIAILAAHPELFEIENHGARHLVAIDAPLSVYGVKSAGSAIALAAEVQGGADAIEAIFGHRPTWFRGATGMYSKSSIATIESKGYHIAGFSRLGDGGALYSAKRTAKSFAEAKDGEVIIAHINQPLKPAGEGVVEGIAALKAQGYVFVTLNEGFTHFTRRIGH